MIERLALDTNAVVDLIRRDRPNPPPLRQAEFLLVPLPVVGELYAGAIGSDDAAENLAVVNDFIASRELLIPGLETAMIYGRLRAHIKAVRVAGRKINDLWIAALSIEQNIPLLSNDSGFDHIPDLTVIHW